MLFIKIKFKCDYNSSCISQIYLLFLIQILIWWNKCAAKEVFKKQRQEELPEYEENPKTGVEDEVEPSRNGELSGKYGKCSDELMRNE